MTHKWVFFWFLCFWPLTPNLLTLALCSHQVPAWLPRGSGSLQDASTHRGSVLSFSDKERKTLFHLHFCPLALFSSFLCPSSSHLASSDIMRKLPENFRHALDNDMKTFKGKYEIRPPPFFPPLWFITSCGHLVSRSSLRSKWYFAHAERSFFTNILQVPSQIFCPLALIWPSPSSSPSVLRSSLIVIHNNAIKTSIQGLRWIIPDFKNKRYPSWQRWIYVLFSYWQSHRALSLPSTPHLSPSPPCSCSRTRRSQYVGSNSREVRSKVSFSLLSLRRIKARRLLRKSQKVSSCLRAVRREERGVIRGKGTQEKCRKPFRAH